MTEGAELNIKQCLKGKNKHVATGKMEPRFSELDKVRVVCEGCEPYEGYVIGYQFRDGRWIYKISISEDPKKTESYDNWVPEEWLERAE